jgi:calcineurin-like phosphoesterase family protein
MDYFFTADQHFGHKTILKHQQSTRPFNMIEEMNEVLVDRWNNRVKPGDVVYCFGDFGWKPADVEWALKRLNGQINLIKGNHDYAACRPGIAKRFGFIKDLHETRINSQGIVMCHYAMRVWNKSHYGYWHIYGHSHGSLPDDSNSLSMDVGVDTNNLYPYSFDEVKEHMSKKQWTPVDHHEGN